MAHAIHKLTPKPPMGWNSFDTYGCAASEGVLCENIKVMAQKLLPYGYKYFVVDNGWFAEYEIEPGSQYPKETHAKEVRIDEYGRFFPSLCYFPNGIKALADECHALGLKFGIHLMRGIPRKAVELNTPVKGTPYTARDIANTEDKCPWCHYNYGVDMRKTGAQEYYNSVVEQLAEWGVDLLKIDDVTGFPREIEGYARAIQNSGRDMILSLSPGGQTVPEKMDAYVQANMLRTTKDIWDNAISIERAFDAWYQYSEYRSNNEVPDGFWFDLDMIPFGRLCLWRQKPETADRIQTMNNDELAGKGLNVGASLRRPSNILL